jgi:di/tricarboxylate transporter
MSRRFPALRRVVPTVDRSWLAVPAGTLAAATVLGYAPGSSDMATMLAITVFCVCLWIGTPVEPWFTALVCIGLVGVAFSTDLALTGFRSPATWLVVFGILIGEAARDSGLAGLVERVVLRWMPGRVRTDAVAAYRYLLVVLCLASLAFAVLVPSSLVRVLVLGPILVSIGDLFAERRAKVGIFLGPLFATYYGASGVLTGSLANIIITGLVESGADVVISWTEWALWMGPVMGVGRSLVVAAVAYALYRPRDPDGISVKEPDGVLDVSGREKRMLAILLVGVGVWATDFVHGLHPLYGALLVALLAFTPRVGVVDTAVVGEADFSIVFFLGAIFAVAEGLRRTGFTDLAATELLSYLPEDAGIALTLAFVVFAAISLAFLMEGLAVASVLTPVLVSFAASVGVPLAPVAMIEAVALNAYFFPYQSAVMVAILGLDVVDTVELTRMATVCTIATLGLLVPIQIAVFALFF